MGYGDEIMATGMARGLHARGKRAAFGDGRKIIWGPFCEEMFLHNPNIARPGSEQSKDLEWIAHYKGPGKSERKYNKLVNGKWVWNYNFKVTPGEFFFSEIEKGQVEHFSAVMTGSIVIEPNVPWQKTVAGNKDWGEKKYQHLTDLLLERGLRVIQFCHKNSRRKLVGAQLIELPTFRNVLRCMSMASLYIGPEGGMHHAAAALGMKAIVIMGGFIPPQVVGYPGHINLTGGAEACGNIEPCSHCQRAMERISVDEVMEAAWRQYEV